MDRNSHGRVSHCIRLRLRATGLTLIELMLAVAIVGILAAVAISRYSDYRERIRVSQAKMDITVMSGKITQYFLDARDYPATLAEVAGNAIDPWGKPYVYVNLTGINGRGQARKDRRLNPLNSDFDLYSMGKDGVSRTQITNQDSLDDVLRASDGAFIDLAANF